MNYDYSITFACYNQDNITKKCIESLIYSETDLSRVVVVDNNSWDRTPELLGRYPFKKVIRNRSNLGCGVAWNQGILEMQSEWTVVMNNDVVVAKNWVDNLISFAIHNDLSVVSPAMIEGDLDYDFYRFSDEAQKEMRAAVRSNMQHAVCMCIHNSVWQKTGFFVPNPRLLGFEDTLFFAALEKEGISTGISGASWVHHFGSVTQKAMKLERGLKDTAALGNRNNKKLLHQNFLERKFKKLKRKRRLTTYVANEIKIWGKTLHGLRADGRFTWI